ncbi:MAG TPA: DinB family protein [Bryobacteraceae bacterium]|nr:DinB family protein [Bryobacteraceae bacterium]
MLHPELDRLFSAIDAAEVDAANLLDGLTDAQVNWQPENGRRWSIAQCLDHLAKMNPFYAGHFLRALGAARKETQAPFRGLKPTWFGRRFVKALGPLPAPRMKAPRETIPASTIPLAGLLESYVRSHDDYRELVRAASEVDVNRVTVGNPFIGAVRMRVSTVLLIIPAHDRRHLGQARQVLQTPGFPK